MSSGKKLVVLFLTLLILLGVVLGRQILFLSKAKINVNQKVGKSSPSNGEAASNSVNSKTTAESPTKTPSSPFFLEIISPVDDLTVTVARVKVQGKTVPGADVFVNENQVETDKNGNFSIDISLQEGENPILISAGNETGEAEIERTVYFETI